MTPTPEPAAPTPTPAPPAASPPAPTPRAPTPPAPPAQRAPAKVVLFHVQAGAFSRLENAEDLVKRLRAKHYAASIVQGKLYRVWIGDPLDRREAEQLAEHLRADGFEATLTPSQ